MKLYHYTCGHAASLIRVAGWVVPHRQIQFPDKPELIWLTDLDVPEREGLGLTSYSLHCDRTEHRVTVSAFAHDVWPWTAYARERGLSRAYRSVVEDCPGVMPMHWWVATVPLPVVEVTP